ncbi:nnp-1 protein putative nuclear protein 1 nop52 [Anaeramoeba ignava]|uniref:Nnp-1 protein putative nuclear protein 1 nop52 n=1 Tax=Anaeramoeba ignava TaxID=1746090 RepID=A0A9Q0R624_ANAIG|nr:nnp-1 protein putative nuclear protein 1 nop52 [Anaeramoeba ignava]
MFPQQVIQIKTIQQLINSLKSQIQLFNEETPPTLHSFANISVEQEKTKFSQTCHEIKEILEQGWLRIGYRTEEINRFLIKINKIISTNKERLEKQTQLNKSKSLIHKQIESSKQQTTINPKIRSKLAALESISKVHNLSLMNQLSEEEKIYLSTSSLFIEIRFDKEGDVDNVIIIFNTSEDSAQHIYAELSVNEEIKWFLNHMEKPKKNSGKKPEYQYFRILQRKIQSCMNLDQIYDNFGAEFVEQKKIMEQKFKQAFQDENHLIVQKCEGITFRYFVMKKVMKKYGEKLFKKFPEKDDEKNNQNQKGNNENENENENEKIKVEDNDNFDVLFNNENIEGIYEVTGMFEKNIQNVDIFTTTKPEQKLDFTPGIPILMEYAKMILDQQQISTGNYHSNFHGNGNENGYEFFDSRKMEYNSGIFEENQHLENQKDGNAFSKVFMHAPRDVDRSLEHILFPDLAEKNLFRRDILVGNISMIISFEQKFHSAVILKRIPFNDPSSLGKTIDLIKQNLLYNELLLSCSSKSIEDDLKSKNDTGNLNGNSSVKINGNYEQEQRQKNQMEIETISIGDSRFDQNSDDNLIQNSDDNLKNEKEPDEVDILGDNIRSLSIEVSSKPPKFMSFIFLRPYFTNNFLRFEIVIGTGFIKSALLFDNQTGDEIENPEILQKLKETHSIPETIHFIIEFLYEENSNENLNEKNNQNVKKRRTKSKQENKSKKENKSKRK